MRKTAVLLLCAMLSLGAYATADTARVYRFRVSLADKKNNPYSLKHPEKFLSPKSLERRAKFKIKLDKHDLPVTPAYVDGLRRAGMSVLNMSKWNNTVLVETTDSAAAVGLTSLPYVSAVRLLWAGKPAAPQAAKTDRHAIVTNRRDTLDKLKKATKDGLPEDAEKDAEAKLQKLHDAYIKKQLHLMPLS